MKLIYVNEKTHRRLKAFALHQRRTMAAAIEVLMEGEMIKIEPTERNRLYQELDKPRIVPGGKP